MRIDNQTHWRTDQIRPILRRCAEMELEPSQRKHLKIVISYRRRGGGSSGCAYIGGRWCKVRVSSDVFDPLDFAIVACHEFAHVRGMRHRDMPHYYMRPRMRKQGSACRSLGANVHPRYEWARGLVVERTPKPARVPVEQAAAAKRDHAAAMLAKAKTRVKRAQTIMQTWQRKVRYYDKRLAAMRGAQS